MDLTLIAPFLPHLIKLGGKATTTATDAIAKKFGEAAWTKAQTLWQRLHPSIEASPDLKDATEKAAAKPDSAPRQAVFQEELETLLTQNPDLAKDLAQILNQDAPDGTPSIQIVQNVTGNNNQTIGQVQGGTVIGTVDGNLTL